MAPAARLLGCLDRTRRTGTGRWIARCPAHDDRSPSLSIRELPDGRVLVHCFGGCAVDAVVGALGLRVGDLFPPRAEVSDRRTRPSGIHPSDALACLASEARVLLLAGRDLERNRSLPREDLERVVLAMQRIDAAMAVSHV